MNQSQDERILALRITLQSVLHQIEEISRNEPYRHELKQRTESYYYFIDRYNNNFIRLVDTDNGVQNSLVDAVAQFDELAGGIMINK